MDSAIACAQNHGLPEGDLHPPREPRARWAMVAKYREAWSRLMLTPAPDEQSVASQLKAGKYERTDLKPERIERAIAADVEFLQNHPTRRGGRKPAN
jgi:hypothetical protein